MAPNDALSYKLIWNLAGKSGHLNDQDTYEWSQGVHNTQLPLWVLLHVQTLGNRELWRIWRFTTNLPKIYLRAFYPLAR